MNKKIALISFDSWLERGLVVMALLLFLVLPAYAGLISKEEEIKIGRQGSKQVESQYVVVNDPVMNKELNNLGQALASHGNRGLKYQFKIIKDKSVNAFAFPGGFIYATSGILKAMPKEQLAFVLGHEVSHVEKKHSVKTIEKQLYSQMGGSLLLGLFSKNQQAKDNSSKLLSAANSVISSRYSQENEKEADYNGMILMSQAGYDPHYAIAALQTLKKCDKSQVTPRFLNSLLGSHPLTSDRIKMAEQDAEPIAKEYYRPSEVTRNAEAAK